jgi:YD repeat-containing protein
MFVTTSSFIKHPTVAKGRWRVIFIFAMLYSLTVGARPLEPRYFYKAQIPATSNSNCSQCFNSPQEAFEAYKQYLTTVKDPGDGIVHWRAEYFQPYTGSLGRINNILRSYDVFESVYQNGVWQAPVIKGSIGLAMDCPEKYDLRFAAIAGNDVIYDCYDYSGKPEPHCDPCEVTSPPNKPKPGISQAIGNPILSSTGTKQQVEIDFNAGDSDGMSFSRTYRSDRGGWQNNLQPFGADLFRDGAFTNPVYIQWPDTGCYWGVGKDVPESFCYHPMYTNTANDVIVQRANGRLIEFGNASDYMPSANINDRITILRDASGSKIGFQVINPADDSTEIFDLMGRLQSVKKRNRQSRSLKYSDSTTPVSIAPKGGLLINVTDSFSRQLNFTYDVNGRMATMIDPAGNVFRYAYDESSSIVMPGKKAVGNLTSVTYPDGKKRIYWYNEQDNTANTANTNLPFALTGITDEKGLRYATYQYNFMGKAISTEHANGVERYQVSFPNPYFSSTVIDPLGTSRNYNFETIFGTTRSTSLSQPGGSGNGQATNTNAYDVNGNVTSSTDFNGVVTTYTYDLARNLETKRVEASGTPAAKTISTTWHPTYRLPLKIAEPSRITTYTHDASGNVLTKTEQATSDVSGAAAFSATVVGTARTWTYTYNQYGQVLTADGPRVDSGVVDKTTYTYDTMGNVATMTNGAGQVTLYSSYDLNGRLLKMTEPGGAVSTMTYFPRGWLTSKQVVNGSASELTSYAYDGVGQLIKATLPDSSSVTYTYDDAHRLTAVADNTGNRIAYTLDPMGNRINEKVTDPVGALVRQTTRVYDALNRLQQVTGAVQ